MDDEKFPKTNVYEVAAKVADLLVENRVEWVLVPSIFKKATEMIEGNDWLGGDTMKNALDERLDGVKVVRMIQVTMAKGTGSMEDPVRQIQRYFDMKGNLIAEVTTDGMSYRRGTSAAICAME